MGISPFGVERSADASTPLAQAYGLLAQAAPEILEAQAKGTINAVSLNAGHPTETVQLGGYTLAFSMLRMRQPPPPAAAGGNPQTSSYAMVISTGRSEEHTSELQSRPHLVCRLLLEKKK